MSIMRLPMKYGIGRLVQIGPNRGRIIAHFGFYNLIWWTYREWSAKELWQL